MATEDGERHAEGLSTALVKARTAAQTAGADAASEILKHLPIEEIEQDLGVREILKAVGSGTRAALRLAVRPLETLATISDVVWDRFDARLARHLDGTPEDKLVEPNPRVTMAVLQAVPDAHTNPELVEMLAALLAAAMKSDTASLVNVYLVEVVSAMSPGDALIFDRLAEVPVVCGTHRKALIAPQGWDSLRQSCTILDRSRDRPVEIVDIAKVEAESENVAREVFVLALDRLRNMGLIDDQSEHAGNYNVPHDGQGWLSFPARRFPLTALGTALSVALGKNPHGYVRSLEIR